MTAKEHYKIEPLSLNFWVTYFEKCWVLRALSGGGEPYAGLLDAGGGADDDGGIVRSSERNAGCLGAISGGGESVAGLLYAGGGADDDGGIVGSSERNAGSLGALSGV